MRVEWNLKAIADDELLRRLSGLLRDSRRVEADLVAHIAEVDARRLYAREAAPSMFAYCTERLHLSEQEAYLRITVARASREYPALLAMLRDGRLGLSGIARLAPHLTPDNAETLLRRATHRSKRQIEELIAELAPRPDAPTVVRKLPDRQNGTRGLQAQLGPDRVEPSLLNERSDVEGVVGATPSQRGRHPASRERTIDRHAALVAPAPGPRTSSSPSGPALPAAPLAKARMEPLSPARYKVQFTGGPELRDALERLQALMRSSVPDGDIGKIIQVALVEKLERLESRRFGKAKTRRKGSGTTAATALSGSPAATRAKAAAHGRTREAQAPRSRHIPAAVRRVVHRRDGGRCTYRDARGRRCTRRHDLEFHHRHPFAYGGEHRPENLALMCRAHNALLAELDYGKEEMARFRSSGSRVSEPVTVYDVTLAPPTATLVGARRQTRRAAPRRLGRVHETPILADCANTCGSHPGAGLLVDGAALGQCPTD